MRRSSVVEAVAFLEDGLPWDALPADVNGFVVRTEPDVDSFAVWELFTCIERRTIIPARMAKKQAVRRWFLFRFMMDDWLRSTGDEAKTLLFATFGEIE
jgi:hypothetical protein